MNKPKIIPYAVCFDGGFPPFLRMYDVNEDNILLLLLFFGVVAINLLLYYARACVCARRVRTPQMGSFFSPKPLSSFFVACLSQKEFQHQKLNSQKHIFNQTLYIRLFCRRRPCAFGVIERDNARRDI